MVCCWSREGRSFPHSLIECHESQDMIKATGHVHISRIVVNLQYTDHELLYNLPKPLIIIIARFDYYNQICDILLNNRFSVLLDVSDTTPADSVTCPVSQTNGFESLG